LKRLDFYMRTLVAILLVSLNGAQRVAAGELPNILWITCEDMSPNLGCYGDAYSISPNIDALAAKGMRYTNAN
jgi:N-sulfoglucosamine sulfohydrolase